MPHLESKVALVAVQQHAVCSLMRRILQARSVHTDLMGDSDAVGRRGNHEMSHHEMSHHETSHHEMSHHEMTHREATNHEMSR